MKKLFKFLLFVTLAVSVIGAAALLWLRYEFQRVQHDSTNLSGWDQVTVRSLQYHPIVPLDFMAVTDHAEALGETRLCYTRGATGYNSLVCELYRGDVRLPLDQKLQSLLRLVSFAIFGQDRSTRVCGANGSLCRDKAIAVWQENQLSTEAFHNHSANCAFTTFHAYEYSLAEDASNLQQEQAALRARLEPLAEVMQIKGDSECRNGIASVLGDTDELCDFEKLCPAGEVIADCGEGATCCSAFRSSRAGSIAPDKRSRRSSILRARQRERPA